MHIKFESQLTEQDQIKLWFLISYRRWTTVSVTALGAIAFFLIVALLISGSWPESKSGQVFLILLPFTMIYMNLYIYVAAKKNYRSNVRLHKPIAYEISDEGIRIMGESSDGHMNWQGTHKVVELGEWILIYVTNQTMINLPTAKFAADELSEFKSFLRSRTDLEVRLK